MIRKAARRLAGEASRAGGYWLNGLQRPPHFLRSLRSSPFYEPVEFGWAVKLVQAFSAVRAEAAAARAPPKGAPRPAVSLGGGGTAATPRDGIAIGASSSSSAWDVVGSRHDAGDRSLSSGGERREVTCRRREGTLPGQFRDVARRVARAGAAQRRPRRRCRSGAQPEALPRYCSPPRIDARRERHGGARRGGVHLLGAARRRAPAPALPGSARSWMKGRQLTDELAGAHLLPHCGSTNARLTAHLPLIVPDGCEIRVGDEVRQYREGEPRLPDGSSARPRSSPRALGSPRVGELLIFDDSYEHEVWNRHPTDVRVVLLIRFWHPDIAPAKYAATKRAMRRAVVRHRRNTCLPPLDVSLTPPS